MVSRAPARRTGIGGTVNAILYGNLTVEIAGTHGARVERARLRQATAEMLRPQYPDRPDPPLMLGRERQSAAALTAMRAARPAGFHAACGYGKTTLLRSIVASADSRGIGNAAVYLRADRDRVEDLLQNLVARLYRSDRPVKLTPGENAALLGQLSAVVAIDDVSAGPDGVGHLLDVLRGCGVVIGSARPVLGQRGDSQALAGLPADSALALVAREMGRPLTDAEVPEAQRLAAAVDGQPLHLRQAAALVREGGHTFQSLAAKAARNPHIIDDMSIGALAAHERQALAVLALAAGVLLPAGLVETVGQIAYAAERLESLHRRGLAEERDDKFGLPACKAANFRQILLADLQLAAAARSLSTWLSARDPASGESLSAGEAAVSILEFAAERGEWATVVRLARAADTVLFVVGRWEAWHHVLGQGLESARAIGDRAQEAFFSHQLGTLAFCHDQLGKAGELLHHALRLREEIGDRDGADVTAHNLRVLEGTIPPGPSRRRWSRLGGRARVALSATLATLALITAVVAITGVLRGTSAPAHSAKKGNSVTTQHVNSHGGPSQTSGSGSGGGQVSGSGIGAGGSTSSTSTATFRLAPQALPGGTAGTQYSQVISASGGAAPYTFSVTVGTLPPGLTLSPQGVLSGIPGAGGTYTFTIQATDSSNPARSVTQAYTLTIAQITVSLEPPNLPDGSTCKGVEYSQTIGAFGGSPPYIFSVTAGALPPGLRLIGPGVLADQVTLTGFPYAIGTYTFTVQATDTASPSSHSGSITYTMQITACQTTPPPTGTPTGPTTGPPTGVS